MRVIRDTYSSSIRSSAGLSLPSSNFSPILLTPVLGSVAFDTVSDIIKIFDGAAWIDVGGSSAGVSSFSAGTTGLTPSSSATGAITLSGTLGVANGGTGVNNGSFTITLGGNLSTGGALSISNSASLNSILVGTGAGTSSWNSSPSLSSLTLITPLSLASGGTGSSSLTTANGLIYSNGTSLAELTPGLTGQVLLGNTGSPPSWGAAPSAGVSSFSAGTTGFIPSVVSTGAITLSGTLIAANGGTGFASYTIGDLLYASSSSALSKLADVAVGSYLRSGGVGAAPLWSTLILPNTATTGDLLFASSSNTITGLADVAAGSYMRSGGVGLAPLWSTLILPNTATTGDLLFASSSNTIANLTDVATGNAIISGGIGAAPSYGKIGLTTHVSGILPVANGGTALSATPTNGQLLIGNGTNYTLATLTQGSGAIITNGVGTITIAVDSSALVTSFSAGTTGFTPSVATSGAITLAGTLAVANGGTGVTTTPTNGQLLIGNGTNYTVATLASGTGISTTTGSGTLQINNTGVTSITGTANQVSTSGSTGAVTLSTPSTFIAPGSIASTSSLAAGTLFYEGTSASVSAAGATQGTATVLTTSYNVVTTVAASTGVILPTPSIAGLKVTVVNKGANTLNVYPNTGAAIDSAGTNIAVQIPVNGTACYQASSTTQWYSVDPVIVAGTGISVAYGNGQTAVASAPIAPTLQSFLSGSGTYTKPAGVLYLRVVMVGGGGGGAGGGGAGATAGTNGAISTFGTSLLTCFGGSQGSIASDGVSVIGGGATIAGGAVGIAIAGSGGSGGNFTGSALTVAGQPGGASALGGSGAGQQNGAGQAGRANSGGGGSGGGATSGGCGGGGAAAGFIDAMIYTPSATYSYSVGAGGTAGGAGAGGTAGSAGGTGSIYVFEHYQ